MKKPRHAAVVRLLSAAVVALFSASCSWLPSADEKKAPAPTPTAPVPAPVQKTAKPLPEKKPETAAFSQELAERMLNNVLKGLRDGDYAVYSTDFSEGLKLVSPEKDFPAEQARRVNLDGDYVSREPMGSLRQGQRVVYFWKARFSKTEDDRLIRLILEKINDKITIANFYIQ